MSKTGQGGVYFAKAIKEISKEIVDKLSNDSLSAKEFEEILNTTVSEMNKELINSEDSNDSLTFASYNIMLMCMAHYVILESKVYNNYTEIPAPVLSDRASILAYFNNVVQTKLQAGRVSKNTKAIKDNASKIKTLTPIISAKDKYKP